MPDASHSIMCISVCGCPALRAPTLSSRGISFLFGGNLHIAAHGQRVGQEAAEGAYTTHHSTKTKAVSTTSGFHNLLPKLLSPFRSSLEDHFNWNL